MQVNSRRVDRNSTGENKVTRSAVEVLSFYDKPPQEEISLDDFELYALDRLQLLRGIELLNTRGIVNTGNEKKFSSEVDKVDDSLLRDRNDFCIANSHS
jgi:pantothenate kinase-related protein Tda10